LTAVPIRIVQQFPCSTRKRRNPLARSKKSKPPERPSRPSYKEIVSIAEENAVSESTVVPGF
jgi:hypothetical protein